MPRTKTQSFVTELSLILDSQQERELLARFQSARQLYNACLNEAIVRMRLVRKSDAYQEAKTFLSRHVSEDKLSLQDAQSEYPRTEPFLLEAWQRYENQTANRVGVSESRLTHSPLEQFSSELGTVNQIADFKSGRQVNLNS